MRVLGLDVSSSTIGISLVNFDACSQKSELISAEFYKPPKKGSVFERLKKTENEMFIIFQRLNPEVIVIEDILFFNKKSTMRTLILLGIFNRTIGLLAAKYLNKDPILLPVATIRALLKKISNDKEIKKENVPDVLTHYFASSFPNFKISKGKKIGQLAKETYDMADGAAVAVTYIEKHLKNSAKKKVK